MEIELKRDLKKDEFKGHLINEQDRVRGGELEEPCPAGACYDFSMSAP